MKGIFGLICSLYAFIWGWQNADTLNMRNVMMAWSICVVIGIVGGAITQLLGVGFLFCPQSLVLKHQSKRAKDAKAP